MSGALMQEAVRPYCARVITVSTRIATFGDTTEYQDTAGLAAAAALHTLGLDVEPVIVVADGDPVGQELTRAVADDVDLVLTCGGTGLAPEDLTPEQTVPLLDRPAPGIAEYLRAKVWDRVPHAVLSRGVAGVADKTLIINLPGSKKAVVESMELLTPLLPHALEQLAGGDHERTD